MTTGDLPELEPLEEVAESIRFVHEQGVQAKLAEFTPIPGTVEWERAGEVYGFDPDSDPLLHNNCVFSLEIGQNKLDEWNAVKRLATEGNRQILQSLNGESSEKKLSPGVTRGQKQKEKAND